MARKLLPHRGVQLQRILHSSFALPCLASVSRDQVLLRLLNNSRFPRCPFTTAVSQWQSRALKKPWEGKQ